MTSYVVELAGVTKRFGEQVAVDRLDLQVPEGSIHGFIGPNGSGKTTTLRVILRIHQPDAGCVRVLGKDRSEAANDQLGYLPEERGLYKRMTVRQVLRYFAQLKGVRRPDPQISWWLDRMGAREFEHKRVEQLSKGMAQKVQFIAAVAAQPRLVILDEPFSGLDPVSQSAMRDVVLELRQTGTTVIFSTHDMEVAQGLCDRVLMIHRGRKVLDGPLDSIRQQYGSNLLRVRMDGGAALPADLRGIAECVATGGFFDLRLADHSCRPELLQQLAARGNLEHFEVVRPSLRDIFVRIAGTEQTT